MDTLAISLLLKPFILLIVAVCICLPARLAVQKFMRPGKLKDFLLR